MPAPMPKSHVQRRAAPPRAAAAAAAPLLPAPLVAAPRAPPKRLSRRALARRAALAALVLVVLLAARALPTSHRAAAAAAAAAAPARAVIVAPPGATPADVAATLSSLRRQAARLPVTVLHAPGLRLARAPDGFTTHRAVALHAPYAAVLSAFGGGAPPPLYLHAGAVLAPTAVSWLRAAWAAHAADPSVAAFFLDSAAVRVRAARGDARAAPWVRIAAAAANESSALPYALAVGGCAFLPNYGPDLRVWTTFAEWLAVRRSDWYRYPSGRAVDASPLSMHMRPERNWTRAAWNVWFSEFLAEYRLHVLYPRLDDPRAVLAWHPALDHARDMRVDPSDFSELYDPSPLAPQWKFAPGRVPYGPDGAPVRQTGLIKQDSVARIVELGRRQGGMVSFTLVNKVFLETARSWLCNVDVAGFRPPGLLWAVTDEETKSALERVPGSTTLLLDEVKGGKETGNEFGNPGYWKLMLERTALIGEILRNGVAVFAFETDAIWLEDPRPYIQQLVEQDADIVGTINTRMEVSGNFFHLRPTLATRRLWDEITSEFQKAYDRAHFDSKLATSWTYIENDQSQLTKLVLRNETWRRSYPLSFLTLDMERFTDGRWYKPEEGFYTSKRAREPVVINNNFVIGVGEKTVRAKKWGHWFWDEQGQKCLDSVVHKAVREQSRVGEGSAAVVHGHDGAHSARKGLT